MGRLKNLAQKISIAALSRVWQMLLKGVRELKISDHQEIVLEMIIVRIAYASTLPDLEEILSGAADFPEENKEGKAKTTAMPNSLIKTENETENFSEAEPGNLLDAALKMFPDAKVK